ncbi:uncharacterized protein LOC143353162 [Halictus rubicundus]|uniref:uncharacterized protein LOC143353162 n=1 Tax=Halictus rubicundus TaxID=77578 RepID=UPI00403746F4
MSANTELFVKPKVRFCQTDADKQNELKNCANQNSSSQSNKPRIRSIITLDKPVIVLKSNKAFDNLDCKEIKSTDRIQNTELSGCDDAIPSCTRETATSLTNTSCKTGNQGSVSDVDNTERAKVCSEKTDKPKISNNSVPALREKAVDKVLKSQNTVKTDSKKRDCARDKKGKENDALFARKGSSSTNRKSSASKVTQCTLKPSRTNISSEKVTVTKSSSVLLTSKKVKPPISVMPCYKYNTAASKTKASTLKKIMVRDVVGPKIKPYIGPGVPHKKQDTPKIAKMNDKARTNSCTSGEKLARPEYNSIMCTINKLNDTKKQKVAVDFEHLPPTYKSLINGKVSSALDFPLDEAIYKNLVDLSVDEKQLPSRLTRSKDPEPRQRDIVPVLSDFFKPESTEEYCTPVSIKTMAAEAVDSWSAFRISDKIFEWKHSLDHI